jgi:chromate transporter
MGVNGGRVSRAARAAEVFLSSLRLGLTSFGGPIAHIGYLRREYVSRRRWLGEEAFTGIVALCQFLPGPASSQINMSVGLQRAGVAGAFLAWAGFTLPSAAALTAFALLTGNLDVAGSAWLHGITLAAVAVVGQAVWTMAPRLAPDLRRAAFAVTAAALSLLLPFALTQVLLIAAAAVLGRLILRPSIPAETETFSVPLPRWVSVGSLALFVLLLAGLPVLRLFVDRPWLALVDGFYRSGALVFGGGHVVLPLLHQVVVPTGAVTDQQFLSGYGAAQAVPGPLFTFAAYLGAMMRWAPNGLPGAALALGAIFLPSFLLLFGVLPFWAMLRARPGFSSALAGVNAAVLGLLASALYTPVGTGAVRSIPDLCVAAGGFALLVLTKSPPLVVVGLCAGAAVLIRILS